MTKTADPEDLDQARKDLARRQRALRRLREAFLNAEPGVEWAQVKAEEADLEEVEARIERTARAQARAAEAQRQATLATIRHEIDEYVPNAPETLVALLHQAEEAIVSLAAACAQHNEKVNGWRGRMHTAGAATVGGRLDNRGNNQGLSLAPGGAIRAGTRELHAIYSGQAVGELIDGLPTATGLAEGYFKPVQLSHVGRDGAYRLVQRAAAEAPALTTEGKRFYKHPSGGVHMFDHELAPDEARRLGLEEIPAEEALNQ